MNRPSVLFLCVHNAGRSQMAAAILRQLAADRVEVFSGGSEPASDINANAVAAMAEIGVDISGQVPKKWTEDEALEADVIVTMGCGDSCPVYPGKKYLDWVVEDPSGKTLDEVRRIRDELRDRVSELCRSLGVAV